MEDHFELTAFSERLRAFVCDSSECDATEAPSLKHSYNEQEFESLALSLFALQYEHNASYRRFCSARGASPRSISDWKQIPALPASSFKDLEISCLPDGIRSHVFYSSGTTDSVRSKHFHNLESLSLYEASLWPWFQAHLLAGTSIPNGLQLICLTPSAHETPNSSLVHMFEIIRRKLAQPTSAVFMGEAGPDGTWNLKLGPLLEALGKICAADKPVMLLGAAFSFVNLLDHLEQRAVQFKLPPGSRIVETGGYKGRTRALPKSELHRLLSLRLGILPSHIVCEYGMSELSSQAYDTRIPSRSCELVFAADPGMIAASAKTTTAANASSQLRLSARDKPSSASEMPRHFRFPPWVRVQIISPETGQEAPSGQTGLIRVFDLANVYSVMALQTEDLGVRHIGGFELLGRNIMAEPRGCSLMSATS